MGEHRTIVIDFDGTIASGPWPDIGLPVPGAIGSIRALHAAGNTLVLFTCREGKLLEAARLWLNEQGIGDLFEGFNTNDPYLTSMFNNDSRKLGGDVYIDDKGIGCPKLDNGLVDWSAVMWLLFPKFVVPDDVTVVGDDDGHA